jgi:hypothetical protein
MDGFAFAPPQLLDGAAHHRFLNFIAIGLSRFPSASNGSRWRVFPSGAADKVSLLRFHNGDIHETS